MTYKYVLEFVEFGCYRAMHMFEIGDVISSRIYPLDKVVYIIEYMAIFVLHVSANLFDIPIVKAQNQKANVGRVRAVYGRDEFAPYFRQYEVQEILVRIFKIFNQ